MKLHLGCGKRYLSGFIHIDLADYPHIDYKHSVKRLPMFDNNSVTLIYASHVLEYFDRSEGMEALKEWKRILNKGGILRLAVPDFQALAEIYLDTNELELIHGPLYGKWEIDDAKIYHKTVYDFSSLKNHLESAGFKEVKHFDWREKLPKDFDDFSQAYIPHMEKEEGKLISLNVEAEK